MPRKKTDNSKNRAKAPTVQKPIQVSNTITCTVNSTYIIDHPSTPNFTLTTLLNDKKIDCVISNIDGKYTGITVVKKNNKFIVYTGKHGLSLTDAITSGILTVTFTEK